MARHARFQRTLQIKPTRVASTVAKGTRVVCARVFASALRPQSVDGGRDVSARLEMSNTSCGTEREYKREEKNEYKNPV